MKTMILVVGRNEAILQTIIRVIHKNDQWYGIAALTDDEALEIFKEKRFNLVLLSSGITAPSEATLRSSLKKLDPEVIILQHYGGGSGLLLREVTYALNNLQEL